MLAEMTEDTYGYTFEDIIFHFFGTSFFEKSVFSFAKQENPLLFEINELIFLKQKMACNGVPYTYL